MNGKHPKRRMGILYHWEGGAIKYWVFGIWRQRERDVMLNAVKHLLHNYITTQLHNERTIA